MDVQYRLHESMENPAGSYSVVLLLSPFFAIMHPAEAIAGI